MCPAGTDGFTGVDNGVDEFCVSGQQICSDWLILICEWLFCLRRTFKSFLLNMAIPVLMPVAFNGACNFMH